MSEADLETDPLITGVPVHEGHKVLGGVVLYQKIGQGGMGAVYRGRHLRLDVDVAVKVMAPPVGLAPDEDHAFVRRFIREAQVAASTNHQNLVRVIDVNAEAGVYYLLMDYVDGESAGDRIARKGRLPEGEAVEICLGAAEGLGEAHREGIVHRDVKPDNIMIDKKGRVRVTDLGLAKAYAGGAEGGAPSMLTQTQTAMGTPHYMSPEQFMSTKTVGPPADVWSLGVTLYQLLTATLPWTDTSAYAVAFKVTNEPMPDPKDVCPGLSDGVCEVIRRALNKEPAERYQDCFEMAGDLRRYLDSVRSGGESTLPDAAAGTTREALAGVEPPAPKTLTLIAEAALDVAARGGPAREAAKGARPAPRKSPAVKTLDTVGTDRAARRGWVLPAALAGGAGLALALVLGLLFAGGSPEEKPDPREKLGSEAEEFYRRRLEAAMAGRDEEVEGAIRAAAGKYDETRFGLKIRELRDTVAARIAEKRDRELAEREAAREAARKEAAFEAALREAEEAEKARDLDEAVRRLKAALAERKDPEVSERLAELEARLAKVERLLAEAARHEKAAEWAEARAKYEEALGDAGAGKRELAAERLAGVKKRIAVEEAVANARREADAGRWREARDLVERARQDGVNDARVRARLDEIARRAAKALAPPAERTGPLRIELILVPGGAFKMGSAKGKVGEVTERPVHEVTVSGYYIGRHEVTRAEFDAFRRKSRSVPKAAGRGRTPAVSMSWVEAKAFCDYLTSIDPAGGVYRLPTEAEWELAARGESGREYPWGDAVPGAARANLEGDADGFAEVAPVGSFPKGATPPGVQDLAGNVAEWCSDWYGPYEAAPQKDPTGPATGKARVVRGGAHVFDASHSRSAARAGRKPANPSDCIGFRVVRELTSDEAEFLELSRRE